MLKKCIWGILFVFISGLYAQENESLYQKKRILITRDTLVINPNGISKSYFKLQNLSGIPIDTSNYQTDFVKGLLIFKSGFRPKDTIEVSYLQYPKFLTQTYSVYDPSKIVPNAQGNGLLYSLSKDSKATYKPFDGLTTSGSITRGVTIGNNQNAVVNSNLDLQIVGKLSDKVSLRASIQDSNIPLQDGGYSQRLDEFDQIFIELYSQDWSLRAGDLFLENRKSKLLNFSKKVQGVSSQFVFGESGNKTTVFGAGALVRGQYARSNFTGQEGNQGPYKLRGNNGELYVLVISGSERVFVNGILVQRGENNQYTIDYNAGEVTFTSLFPITSEMRIVIEYQYSDRSYNRFVAYGGVVHEREKWQIGGFFYNENDVKNQPLQQNLTPEQVAVLQNAGDNLALMNAPSAYADSFSENKILYRKVTVAGTTFFEFSNNPNDELFNVRFTLVGNNQGNYILSNNQAVGKIYEYIAPVDGIPQGNYEPVIRLIAPTQIQMATVIGKYNPSEKTNLAFELGLSRNDLNLFSSLDDTNNQGIAFQWEAQQRLWTRKWTLDAFTNLNFIDQDFRTIERLFTIEFGRDWNLNQPMGNQRYLIAGLRWQLPQKSSAVYQVETLNFSKNYSGIRHVFNGHFSNKNWNVTQSSSIMQNQSGNIETRFGKNDTALRYDWGKNWSGTSIRMEDYQEKNTVLGTFNPLSQRFTEYGTFSGRGDTTKVYLEIGYLHRINDSLQNGILSRVNRSNTYYLKSRLLQNSTSDLTAFISYRTLKFENRSIPTETSLNSRILYNGRFLNQLINTTTLYETAAGTLPQQEFTYLEVEPGRGLYMWNDYNNNGIQELQEFEIAPFPDQAKYIRVFLPNQIFIKTHQVKFSQSLSINPGIWQNETGLKKFLSHFYHITSFTTDRKTIRSNDSFNLNPFTFSDDSILGLTTTWQSSLFYNRGKQKHSTTYTYSKSDVKNLLSVGLQESRSEQHFIQYSHLHQKSWLFQCGVKSITSSFFADTFEARNFETQGWLVLPKISYLFSKNASWDVFYQFQNKENTIGQQETLRQNLLGTSFNFSGKKQFTLNGEFNYIANTFIGDALSAVGFQMLEGLQPGKNQTWRLLVQKNLTQFLDLNISYQGRKSETSNAIHTGSIQLRAFF